MATITKTFLSCASIGLQITKTFLPCLTTQKTMKMFLPCVDIKAQIAKTFKPCVAIRRTMPDSLKGGFRYGWYLDLDGTTIDGTKATSARITWRLGAPLEWEINFPDSYLRNFAPLNASGIYYPKLLPDVFSGGAFLDGIPHRFWNIYITVNNIEYSFKKLIQYGSTRTISGGAASSTFTGKDYSRLLEVANQSFDSWVSTAGNLYTANQIIQEILDEYSILYSEILSDDYYVQTLHFQGQAPIDIINALLEVPQATWLFHNGVFRTFQPNYSETGADLVIKDNEDIIDCTHVLSPTSAKNQVIVCRTESVPAFETFEREGDQACGLQRIDFAHPKYRPHLSIVNSRWGVFEEIDYYDSNGIFWDAGWNGVAAGVQFIFRQNISAYAPPDIDSRAYWKIKISGVPASLYGLINVFDDAFSVEVRDTNHENDYGSLPSHQPISNPLIPTEAWARIHGQRWLDNQQRLYDTIMLKTRLNPEFEPGMVVKVTSYGHAISGVNYLIEQVTHNLTPTDPSTELNCVICGV